MTGFSKDTVSQTTFFLKEFNLVIPEACLILTIPIYNKAIFPIVQYTALKNSYLMTASLACNLFNLQNCLSFYWNVTRALDYCQLGSL